MSSPRPGRVHHDVEVAVRLTGDQFFGIHNSNGGRIIIFGGGVPLANDGQVVGAVGVSGGTGEQDQTVAEAAAAGF